MEKLKNILFNKVTIGAILLFVQLAWLLLFFYQLSSYSTVITAIFGLVSVLMMLAIVSSKDNPVYKIGWLILIGLMPMFGTFLYLISANKQPAKKLRKAIQESEARIEQQLEQVSYPQQSLPIADEVKGISDYIASQGTYARHGNTDVAYFKLGEDMYASMLKDMERAQSFIFFEYFIVGQGQMWDGMKEILIRKAQEGLDVRVMYDDLGSLMVLPKGFKAELESQGVKVVTFNPMVPYLALGMNNRDHRKILVIDGDVAYFKLGEDMYASMLKDMERAQSFIFFEYFIVGQGQMWDGMKEILIRKAQEGLDVRVMYDDLGSLMVLPKGFKAELESQGVKVVTFNPMVPYLALGMNNRDHRKILVIDGDVAYNGGINIADEYINVDSKLGHWKDTGLRLEGDGVANLTLMFLSVWDACRKEQTDIAAYLPKKSVRAKGYVQPFSDSPLDEELISENLYMDILWNAKDYVYIFTPYLIIDHEMTLALTMAAKRGVDVRIVVPKIPDKKAVYTLTESYFRPLLEAGVRLYRYTPGFIHAKSYLADDKVGVVGTINMDYRSLYLHFECGTFLYEVEALKDLKQDYEETFAVSEEVHLKELGEGLLKRTGQAVLRVLSPLF